MIYQILNKETLVIYRPRTKRITCVVDEFATALALLDARVVYHGECGTMNLDVSHLSGHTVDKTWARVNRKLLQRELATSNQELGSLLHGMGVPEGWSSEYTPAESQGDYVAPIYPADCRVTVPDGRQFVILTTRVHTQLYGEVLRLEAHGNVYTVGNSYRVAMGATFSDVIEDLQRFVSMPFAANR